MKESLKESEYINSIVRATEILNLYRVKDVKYLGVTDISQELGLHKTSVFRIVKRLEHTGWLVQDAPNGKYRIGAKLIVLSAVSRQQFSIDDMIYREMQLLGQRFNEDIVLTGLVDGYQAVCITKIKSNNALQISSNVGYAIGMTKGSTGKVLLAYLPKEMQEKAIQLDSPDITEEGREALFKTLEKIRETGYCVSTSERDEGVSSISMPLFGRDGRIIYSLGIVGEEHRMTNKGREQMRRALQASIERIQEVLSIV